MMHISIFVSQKLISYPDRAGFLLKKPGFEKEICHLGNFYRSIESLSRPREFFAVPGSYCGDIVNTKPIVVSGKQDLLQALKSDTWNCEACCAPNKKEALLP
ncbi:hypothetical protein BpHYR1_002473 [Brachionus plicatilis]|uniref:Uncharacterized protein n=1 Tax=Brachionus plicatilis TaxID=10195 RepID=A0A3M7SB23_BRAPC|nr:hypothetical protein BpHYR1_002473 [Brachionus plicatilis]